MPLNGPRLTVELNLGLEKSEKSQGISYCQYCVESGNPVNSTGNEPRNFYDQPIRKALKTPEFVLSEAIYCRTNKKLRGAGQVHKA